MPKQSRRFTACCREREAGRNCAVRPITLWSKRVVVILGEKELIAAMKKSSVVKVDPEIMSGTPCFAGTRVPARTLIDYIEGGDTLDDFLEGFPTVTRAQAIAFLEEASERMMITA